MLIHDTKCFPKCSNEKITNNSFAVALYKKQQLFNKELFRYLKKKKIEKYINISN